MKGVPAALSVMAVLVATFGVFLAFSLLMVTSAGATIISDEFTGHLTEVSSVMRGFSIGNRFYGGFSFDTTDPSISHPENFTLMLFACDNNGSWAEWQFFPLYYPIRGFQYDEASPSSIKVWYGNMSSLVRVYIDNAFSETNIGTVRVLNDPMGWSGIIDTLNSDSVTTPIPGAILLFAPGLACFAAMRRRFKK